MQRVICLIFLSFFLNNAYGKYQVIAIGASDKMVFAKTELQGHIARETNYCRGAHFPKIDYKPKCKLIGPNKEQCKIEFHCHLVRPGMTRTSNIAKYPISERGLKALRQMDVTVAGKKVSFREKIQYADTKKVNHKIYEEIHKERVNKVPEGKTKEEVRTESYTNFQNLERIIEEQEFGLNKLEVDSPLSENFEVDIATAASEEEELQQELAALMGEDYKNLEIKPEPSQVTVTEKKKIEKSPYDNMTTNQKLIEASGGFYLWGFSYSFVTTGSTRGSTAQSADLAWSPVMKVSRNWSLRGNFGFHNVRAFIEEEDEEENFSVYDYGLSLERTIIDNAFLDIGFGIQQWGSSVGGSYNTFSLGGGYRLEKSFLLVVDQIFLNYTAVSNPDANKEFRFGLRTYF